MRRKPSPVNSIRNPGTSSKLETQVILLSVAAAMFAWVMQSLLDFYFHYWDRTYPQILFLDIPQREIYSRVGITISFLVAGTIISRMVRRVDAAESQWRYLYACLRAIREVNHLITHVRDRAEIVRGVCERLVKHRHYERSTIVLGGTHPEIAVEATQSEPSDEVGEVIATPLRCNAGVIGELTATLPLELATTADEREFLQEVADDVAFSLNTIRIDEERERRAAVQRALYQVTSGLRTSRTAEDLHDAVQYGLSEVLDTRGVRITLYDPDAKTITEVHPRGDGGSGKESTRPAIGTLAGFVAKTGVARRIERSDMVRMIDAGLLVDRGDLPAAWIGAPFEIEGEVRGVVALAHPTDESGSRDDELDVLTFVADQLGKCVERQEVEASIREHREQLQTILDSVPAYIYYKDAGGRYLKVNKALADMAGIPESKWFGKTFDELLPEAGGAAPWTDQEVVRTGEPKLGVVEVLEIDGRMRWLQTDRIPYRDNDGEIVGVIGLSIDVTESREADAALAVKEEELRQSQKMEAIGLLAGGIAHDFNNLLTAILGYAELSLATADPGDPITKSLSGIQEAAGRAAALTRQLLAFSRRQSLQLKTVDLSEVVENVRRMLERLIGEDVELVTNPGADVPLVSGDPAQIEQIIVNLAVNARDAMPEGGTLSIGTARRVLDDDSCRSMPQATPGTFACLSVSDTGVGMTEDILAHIFEPFFTTKGPQAGTGLGLSVIYGNVQQHDGWIDVETAPGQGTTFRIFFPEATELPETEDEPDMATVPEGLGERILLVEDEELIRDLAARVLRSKGYNVVDVSTAEEALEHVEGDDGTFDLVFSDVVLPGMSGLELAEAVRERSPESKILLCSGYADRRLKWPTICERGLPFLDKPYSVSELLRSVRGVMQ